MRPAPTKPYAEWPLATIEPEKLVRYKAFHIHRWREVRQGDKRVVELLVTARPGVRAVLRLPGHMWRVQMFEQLEREDWQLPLGPCKMVRFYDGWAIQPSLKFFGML